MAGAVNCRSCELQEHGAAALAGLCWSSAPPWLLLCLPDAAARASLALGMALGWLGSASSSLPGTWP